MRKEQLIEENARLKEQNERLIKKDEQTRKELSELLDSYEYVSEFGYSKKEKKTITQSWMGIAFLIGELKADANYSCVLQAKEDFRMEVDKLRNQLKQQGEDIIR